MRTKKAILYDQDTLEHMSKDELVSTVLELQRQVKSKPAGRKTIDIPADVIDRIIELRQSKHSLRSISDIIATENGLKLSYEKVRWICNEQYGRIGHILSV